MTRISTAAVILVALMLAGGIAMAKGGVGQITIVGPGLEHPIEVGEPQTLDEFNPWRGLLHFLGERLEENAVDTSLVGPYRVRFSESALAWVYEFSYYRDTEAAVGYILLPEPDASLGFVLPGGWYRSSDAWIDVMSEQLEVIVTPTGPTVSELRESMPQLLLYLFALTLLGLVVITGRYVRERKGRSGLWRVPPS